MTQPLSDLKETPSQTAGPYVHIGCTPNVAGIAGIYPEDLGARLITGPVKGTPITVTGTIFDGAGAPLRDALLEIWQADSAGRFSVGDLRGPADPHFTGWGRSASDGQTGLFAFDTVKPGRVPFRDRTLQAPHISLWIVARGINLGLQTRIYFADDPDANAEDPVLSRIEHQSRIPTLLATPEGGDRYRFDVHLQGDHETIFFDF